MGELSVNISGAERQQIERKAVELFFKTAKARHPDENFYKDITKRIYEDALINMEQHTESAIFPQLNFVSKYNLTYKLRQLQLPDNMYILTLQEVSSNYSKLLDMHYYLSELESEDIHVESKFTNNTNVLFPFNYYGDDILTISDEIKTEINEYNTKMSEIYDSLDRQLQALVHTISQCKTTKAFYAKLPNLTSLFPNSLSMKISRKNDVGEVELTEEQKLMQDATNSIATANLLGD